nr:TonB-dependent receptor [Pedobacter glucosidilyticus]
MQKLIISKQLKLLLCVSTLMFLHVHLFGQALREIKGVVKDGTGEPLAGATVKVKSTTRGVTTDLDGKFTISIADGATLVVSYVGYKTLEVRTGTSTYYPIELASENVLTDIVVTGYGVQRKRDITGSTTSIKAEEITQVPVMSPAQALQGRAAGVNVIQSSGAPGGATQVQIRGVNNTGERRGSNSPLFVIDGVPLFEVTGEFTAGGGGASTPDFNLGNPLATINPNDIESMEVLKDASATAIYGSRAANGVIIITTKSGKAGKSKINLDYYYGAQQMTNKWDMLNATEGMMVRNQAIVNVVSGPRNIEPELFNPFSFASSPDYPGSTDWQNELFRTAPVQDLNLSVSGGVDKIRYAVSGNYFNQEGIFLDTYSERLSGRANLDFDATDKLSFGIRTTVSRQTGDNAFDANGFQGNVLMALTSFSYQPAYFADGSYWGPPNTNGVVFDNRNGVTEAIEFDKLVDRNRVISNVFGEYKIAKGLTFKSSFGIDLVNVKQRTYTPAILRGPTFTYAGPDTAPNNFSRSQLDNTSGRNWIAEQTLNYNRTFNNDHKLDVLLGFSAQEFNLETNFMKADGSLNPNLLLIGPNNATMVAFAESVSQNTLVSQFSRVNYSYKGRYLFTGTVRRDGSSNFGPDNRYGIFPSASVAYRISEENFFKPLRSVVDDLKIRASYGITGNQDIGAFAFIALMNPSNYVFNNALATGTAPNGIPNAGLRWEANKQTDIGLDVSFLKGRIVFAADYFVKNATDLLYNNLLPRTSGFFSQQQNLGQIQNKGFEFALNTVNIDKALKWTSSINVSTIKNKVINIGVDGSGAPLEIRGITPRGVAGPINLTKAGYPIGSFWGYQTDGLYQTVDDIYRRNPDGSFMVNATTGQRVPYQIGPGNRIPQPGDQRYIDVNNDGILNDADKVILGSPFPDLFGGISNNFTYKNFGLNVFANFSLGNELFNQARLQIQQGLNSWGSVDNLNAWTGPGTTNTYPRATAGAQSQLNLLESNRFIDDASFLRIRNITFSYQVPAKFINKYKMQSLRLYTSVSNAFTFTKYQGWDPEVSSNGSNGINGGHDLGSYPVARTFQMGINIGL